jgi:ribosome-binding factor A
MSKFDGTKNTGRAKKPPSHRMMRLNEDIRFALSGIFTRGEIRDEYLKDVSVTVTEVRCSPDMRNATVYVIPFLGEDSEQVLLGLTRNKKYIRGQLTKLVSMKFMPVLTFLIDGSFGEAKHIEELLQSDKVQRDLNMPDNEDDQD